ncbi:MAG: gfo/Idh/MocA family oxidoreductase [Planctomycetaceae bacterium]|nr:gfo/Idh/MocA family oxidoreductase [Planctomycetaceae bacterium]
MTVKKNAASRRDFLKIAGLAAVGTVAAGQMPRFVHAGENNTIKIALVGCGGRGTGAADQALSTAGPTELVAMADFFESRLEGSLDMLKGAKKEKVNVPKERRFIGLDAYKHAVDAVGPGGVVLLATPPAFRPVHFEHAVSKNVHVFMEKSFAVDAPGVRRVIATGKRAGEKNLKVAGGLMSRHSNALQATVEQLHSGIIGDLVTCWAYREHEAVGLVPKTGDETELGHQIRNYSNFTWLNGSFLLDWLIHNLDVCCWAKGGWPVSAQGQGGRQTRTEKDQLFDHYGVEYTFADGTRLFAQGRHVTNCWGFFGSIVHGTKGSAILGEGISKPKIFSTWKQTPEKMIWEHAGEFNQFYQTEHDLLFDAIRNDKPYNESERCACAAMVGILGRMASESGKEVLWDDALASDGELAPGLDHMTEADEPPVVPDANGDYPIARPGITDPYQSTGKHK